MKRINVFLHTDLHKKAKSMAALKGMALKDYISKAVEEKVKKDEKKRNVR